MQIAPQITFEGSFEVRSANDDDGITNGPDVTDTIRPSKIEISHAVEPISSRKVVVRYRPRRTSVSSPLTRSWSVSIIPASPASKIRQTAARCGGFALYSYDGRIGRGVNRLHKWKA